MSARVLIDAGWGISHQIVAAALPADVVYTDVNNAWTVAQNLPDLTTIGTNLVLSATGLTAPRTFTFPDLTGTVVTLAATQTLTNKTMDGAANTFTNIGKSSIPATAVYTDQTNTWGTFAQIFPSSDFEIQNPLGTFQYIFVGSAIVANRNVTLPLLTAADTFVFAAFTQTLTNKTESAVILTTACYLDNAGTSSLSFYNTSDVVTNYERIRMLWSSNVFNIDIQSGGSGSSARTIQFQKAGTNTFFLDANVNLNTATALKYYNTSDVVTNTEYITSRWVSNVFLFDSQKAGSGTLRAYKFQMSGNDIITFNTDNSINFNGRYQSNVNIASNNLHIWNPAVTFTYTFITSAIVANRNITVPLLTSDDTFVFQAFAQTLTNKTMDGGSNTFTNIGKGSLPGTAVYTDQANTWGTFAQIFPSSDFEIQNPLGTFQYIFVGSAIVANRNVTLPLLTAADTFVFANFAQTLDLKTLTHIAGDSYLQNAATLSFYNTTDVTTNYERVKAFWSSNVFVIDSQFGGTGTKRRLSLRMGGSDMISFDPVFISMNFNSRPISNMTVSTPVTLDTSAVPFVFTGDWSVASITEVQFTNNSTAAQQISLIPNIANAGTVMASQLSLYNGSDTTNYEQLQIYTKGTNNYWLDSVKGGTGTLRTINLGISGVASLTINTNGSLTFGGNAAFGAFYQEVTEIAAPTSPASGTRRIYVDSTSHDLTVKHSDGTVVDLEAGGSPLPSKLLTRWGLYQAANIGATPEGDGLLRELVLLGGSGNATSVFVNNRPAIKFTSGGATNNYAGWRTVSQILTLALSPTITFKVSATVSDAQTRLKLGIADSTTLGDSMLSVLNNIAGIIIGYGVNDTNVSVTTNDGQASQTINTSGMPAVQTTGTAAIYKLSWNNGTSTLTWSVQTAAGTTTTGTITTGNLPTTTKTMYVYCCAQEQSTTAIALQVEDVEVSFGSDINAF